jgi:hypothetical protein
MAKMDNSTMAAISAMAPMMVVMMATMAEK